MGEDDVLSAAMKLHECPELERKGGQITEKQTLYFVFLGGNLNHIMNMGEMYLVQSPPDGRGGNIDATMK